MNKQTVADMVQAQKDWAALREQGGRAWKLDYTHPQTSGTLQLATALMHWRAGVVQEAIDSRGRSRFYRALLEDLLWHVWGEGRELKWFTAAPKGMSGVELLESEYDSVGDRIAVLLEKGEGKPANLSADADHHQPIPASQAA